jgi:CheY-like chemotaxis protein
MGAVLNLVELVKESRNGPGAQGAPQWAGRVLLVDDVYEDAALLAVLLAPLEATVLVARSAEEALRIVDERLVDLVVTDLNMPDASGLDLTRELGERDDAPVVVVLSGTQCAQDEASALELGAVACLRKPVDVDRLIKVAREILLDRRSMQTGSPAIDSLDRSSGAI